MSTRTVSAWLIVAACVVLVPALHGQQNVPTTKPVGTASITGRVVDADTGASVPGASVELTVTPAPSPTQSSSAATAQAAALGSRSSPPSRVLTDEKGQFVFKTAAVGTADFRVIAHNYVGGGYNQLRADGPPQALSLADGQHLDKVTLKVWRTGAITGRVIDEAGEPVVGASVRVLRRVVVGGHMTLQVNDSGRVTDDRGVYRVSGLSAGDYLIEVPVSRVTIAAPTSDASAGNNTYGEQFGNLLVANGERRRGDLPAVVAEGNRLATYPTMFYPSAPTSSRATVLSLRTSEEKSGIDVQLTLAPAFAISGVIAAADGSAAVDTFVELLAVDEQGNVDAAAESVAASSTGARGEFTMLGVPAGTYQIAVLRGITMGLPSRGGGPAPATAHTGMAAWSRGPVVVSDRDVTNVSMTLHPTLMVSGQVAFNGTSPQPSAQQLARGVRLERVGTVSASRADGRVQVPPSTISATGTFAVAGLLPGGYMVLPTSWPSLKWIATSITAGGHDVSDMPVDIDRDVTDVVITFTDKPSSIGGTVRRNNGEAETSALVVGFPVDPRAWSGPGIHKFSTRTTASGTYTVPSLAPGEYLVAAIPDELAQSWQAPETLKRIAAAATRVTIGEGLRVTENLVMVTIR